MVVVGGAVGVAAVAVAVVPREPVGPAVVGLLERVARVAVAVAVAVAVVQVGVVQQPESQQEDQLSPQCLNIKH